MELRFNLSDDIYPADAYDADANTIDISAAAAAIAAECRAVARHMAGIVGTIALATPGGTWKGRTKDGAYRTTRRDASGNALATVEFSSYVSLRDKVTHVHLESRGMALGDLLAGGLHDLVTEPHDRELAGTVRTAIGNAAHHIAPLLAFELTEDCYQPYNLARLEETVRRAAGKLAYDGYFGDRNAEKIGRSQDPDRATWVHPATGFSAQIGLTAGVSEAVRTALTTENGLKLPY